MAVDPATWDASDLNTRHGIVDALECAIAGPGNIVASIQVIGPGEQLFAVFDGVTRQIDIKR